MIETHDLVSYESLGQTQQLHLVYKSTSADVMPIVTFGWNDIGAELHAYLLHASPAR